MYGLITVLLRREVTLSCGLHFKSNNTGTGNDNGTAKLLQN